MQHYGVGTTALGAEEAVVRASSRSTSGSSLQASSASVERSCTSSTSTQPRPRDPRRAETHGTRVPSLRRELQAEVREAPIHRGQRVKKSAPFKRAAQHKELELLGDGEQLAARTLWRRGPPHPSLQVVQQRTRDKREPELLVHRLQRFLGYGALQDPPAVEHGAS